MPEGFVVPAVRHRDRGGGIVAHDLERRGRQCFHREAITRRVVAQRLARRARELRGGADDLLFRRHPVPHCDDHVAGDRLRDRQGDLVAVTLALDRSGQHDAKALLDRELLRGALVEHLRRPHAKRPPDAAAIVGVDEAGALERDFEDRLQRLVERGVAGAVPEVGDHDRHRVVRFRRDRPAPRQRVRARHQYDRQQREHRHHRPAEARRNRNQLAGVVERGERRAQLRRRLKPRRRIPLQAAADDLGERLRDRLVDRAQRRESVGEPLPHRGDPLLRGGPLVAPQAGQHLVQDHAERVDIGSHPPPGGALLRRHVSSVPTMLPSVTVSLDAEMPKSMISACSSSPPPPTRSRACRIA